MKATTDNAVGCVCTPLKQHNQQSFFAAGYSLVWSRRESNPRPNICPISFLHVYFGIGFREVAGPGQTYSFPICFDFRS